MFVNIALTWQTEVKNFAEEKPIYLVTIHHFVHCVYFCAMHVSCFLNLTVSG